MILERLMDHAGQPVGRGVFRDNDTLAIVLPALVDLSLYTTLHDHVLDERNHDNTSALLIDFSETRQLRDSGIAAFMSLQKLVRTMHLRLFMVNSPDEMHDRLGSIVPDANWIDFTPGDSDTSRKIPVKTTW